MILCLICTPLCILSLFKKFWNSQIFEYVGFPKETRQNLPFIEKYATTSKFSYV